MAAQIPSLKIGVSGVRGIAGVSLTPQIVASFAAAFGTYCGPRPVVIGSDTRPSRQMVVPAAVAGLLSVGCTPVNLGIVPVPTLQFHLRKAGAAGGICITASHNPVEWNALKFCDSDGITLRPSQFAEVLDLYHQGVYPRVAADQIPEVRQDDGAFAGHMAAVMGEVDVGMIRERAFRVAVDCCNGAASLVSPEFLRRLGCEVIELHTNPDQLFPRDPEPLRENIGDLCAAVEREKADVGFAQDADADRLALVDETGTPLGEDATLALVVRHLLTRYPGPVVANLSTSRMLDDVVAAAGQVLYRSPVGEINVLETMKRVGSWIGGEGNGGVIVRALNPCRDSFVAMALILESMARERQTVSQLRQRLPDYHIIKEKVACRPRQAAAFIRLMKHVFRGEELDLTDGIKVDWPDRWLHVRASNTEPIVRVVAEGKSPEVARRLVDSVLEYLRPENI